MAKPLDYNYAKDLKFSEDTFADLIGMFRTLEYERRTREDKWQEYYRAWSVDTTEADRGYEGMANLNLPQIRKEVETMSRRIVKGLFPEDYLKASPARIEDDDLTVANTQVVRHYFDNVIKMKTRVMPWVKQGVLYGTSPMRTFWKKKENDILYKKREFKADAQGIFRPSFKKVMEKITIYDAPYVRAEDLFQTFVYPSTATSPDELQAVFWRTKVRWQDIEKKVKDGTYIIPDHQIETIKNMGKSRDWQFEQTQERLQQFGESGELIAVQGDKLFNLLEIWIDLEIDGQFVPVVVEILEDSKCVRIQRNPYWHQSPPFVFMRYIIPPPGEFYGRGLPEAAIAMQQQLNDTLNQTMDSTTLALNNVTIINPAFAPNSESFEVEPRAIWWADPNGVKQMQFPDLSDTGLKSASMLRGIITEMSDNSPQLPDPIAGKARSTGQAQLAVNEWMTDVFIFLEMIANEAMNPLAKQIHMLLQQNIEDDKIIRITGKYADTWINRVVDPSDIVGNFDFSWMSAIQIENNSVKTQQIMNFIRIFAPVAQQVGVKLNWENLMIKIFRDGFNIRDVENIVETSRLSASTPPEIENKLVRQGATVKVQMSDDDQAHKSSHANDLLTIKEPYNRALMGAHIREHDEQMAKKQQAMMMMQQQMQMQQAQQQGQQGPGNTAQMSESTNPQDLERGLRNE